MTDAANWRFTFTVTDLARFLGKSPVTIRGWERRGEVKIPRDKSGIDRKLNSTQVREVAKIARGLGRISQRRLQIVEATMTLIETIESENQK